jgi:hypothetical protein
MVKLSAFELPITLNLPAMESEVKLTADSTFIEAGDGA